MHLHKKRTIDFVKPKNISIPLVRIGGDQDGAYLVPSCIEKASHCFSPGVNNVKPFEDDLAVRFGIKSFLCDFSSDVACFATPLIPELQSFRKLWLDIYDYPDSITLGDWINSEKCTKTTSLVLQIDIERAEYRNLLTTKSSTLSQFQLIIIEVHCFSLVSNIGTIGFSFLSFLALVWLNFIRYPLSKLSYFSVVRLFLNGIGLRLEPYLISYFFHHLSKTHTVVHAHPNNCCGQKLDVQSGLNFPRVMELTLLRNDIYNIYKSSETLVLPHPLDLEVNVPGKSPIVLNKFWTQ